MGKQVSGWKSAPIVQEDNGVEEPKWKSAPIVDESVKKKDNTLSDQESASLSTDHGSEESGAESKQPIKPSGNPTAEGKVLSSLFDMFTSAARTGYSTLKHTFPQALDYLRTSENFNPPDTYEEKIGKDIAEEAHHKGLIYRSDIEKYALDKKKELIGEKGIELERILHNKDIAKKKIEAKNVFEEHNKERSEELKDIPQSYRDVKDVNSALKYAGGLAGQALASFPLIMTGGASEGADMYYEGVDEKAKALSEQSGKKVTPEDVIKAGLDKDAKNYALGVQFVNGALDVVGFETILGTSFKKQIAKEAGKELAKKGIIPKLVELSKPALGEALTETAQELNTFASSRLSAGKSKEEVAHELKTEYPRLIDSALGGLIGGGVLGAGLKSTPTQAITNAKEQITSTADTKSIEDHAAKIIEAVENQVKTPEGDLGIKPTPEEGVQDAISKSQTGEILQREQSETGSTRSERGRVEPSQQGQEITRTSEAIKGQDEDNALREQPKEEEVKVNPESELNKKIDNLQDNGQNENRGNETDSLSRGSEQERSGSQQDDAESITRRVQEASSDVPGAQRSTREIKKQQDLELERYAIEKGESISSQNRDGEIREEKNGELGTEKQVKEINYQDILNVVDDKEIYKLRSNITSVNVESFLRNLEKQGKIKTEC